RRGLAGGASLLPAARGAGRAPRAGTARGHRAVSGARRLARGSKDGGGALVAGAVDVPGRGRAAPAGAARGGLSEFTTAGRDACPVENASPDVLRRTFRVRLRRGRDARGLRRTRARGGAVRPPVPGRFGVHGAAAASGGRRSIRGTRPAASRALVERDRQRDPPAPRDCPASSRVTVHRRAVNPGGSSESMEGSS